MSRYIDADALITDLNKGLWGKDWDKVLAEAIINDAPSIDIVRCKECKYYAEHNELYINAPTNCVKHSTINHYVVVNADDFCSYGEREGEL